ncbi:MAG: 3-keto-5-aminohexanoate cleavage protein [Sulfitobacter sp.]
MTNPCILCVAITGSLPTKAVNPAVPISIAEQVESTHAAYEAGASICHAHVRNADETPSADPEKFAALQEGIKKHCPDMIIQFSTGGRSGAGKERGGMLSLRPDMASLSVGSNNFPNRVYENAPELVDWLASEMRAHEVKPEIEAFDLSHIHKAVEMNRDGRISGQVYVQFVMGVKNAMPVDRPTFDFYVETVKRLMPDAQWCAAGVGPGQIILNEWAISAGGHARTGLEDNVRLDKNTLAPSNAALIARAAALCEKYERPVATAKQAREILGLRAV